MIIKHTYKPDTILDTPYYYLSEEERKEIENIVKRLQEIFGAESVEMTMDDISITGYNNYTIRLCHSPLGKIVRRPAPVSFMR